MRLEKGYYLQKGCEKMNLKTVLGITLTMLLITASALIIAVPSIAADTSPAELPSDCSTTLEADGGDSLDLTDSEEGFLSEVFSRNAPAKEDPTPYVNEDRLNFNRTNEWADFAKVDGDSAELVVGVNNGKPSSYTGVLDLVDENDGDLVDTVSMGDEIKAIITDIPLGAISSFVAGVQTANLSRYIEPNMKVQACFVPNDPYWSYQWGPRLIEADYAWNTTQGDPSVLVAVIDTGIDWNHPDLAANYVPLGYDWVNDDTDPMDDEGHGTHCAGIIAAVINNSIGVAGVAQVLMMAEKGLDQYGEGYEDDLANAIVHAVDQGADILSNSWGGYVESALIRDAVEYAYDSGVLIIAAAGNDGTSLELYPAGYGEVIAVTATDEYDNPAWFTNFGDWVELAAPGVDIYSTFWDDSYTYMSGTSMATPHVAGVAALVLSQFPNMTRDQLRLQLRYTADDLGSSGFDEYYGYGRVNARRAVEEAPPDHDLYILDWERPSYVEPGDVATISTMVFNFGVSNESDITVQLLVNGSVVDGATIGFLASGESATVNCSWSPAVEGIYNVTSYVVPVPDETVTENNVVWAYVYVGFPVKAVVLDSAGNYLADAISNWEVLNTNWYLFGSESIYIDYTTLSIDDITYDDITAPGADVLIISCAYDWEFTDSEIDAITRYVHEGHGLIATAGTLYYGVPNNNKLAPLFGLNETITWYTAPTDLLHIQDPSHPLFVNVPDPYTFRQVVTVSPYDGQWDWNELVGGTYVALGQYQESAIVVYQGLVYISPWLETIPPYYHYHLQLLYNAITWSTYQKPEHELVVSLECPPHLEPGESTMLNATVANMGLNNETNVELYLLVHDTVVNFTSIPELLTDASYTISYWWTPTLEATYSVTAYAPPKLGEEFTSNNFDSAIVYVRFMRFILWDDVHDNDGDSLTENYLGLYQLLTATGFIVDELTSGTINIGLLANYDILVLMDPELDFAPSEIADIQSWVAAGGAAVIIPDGGYPLNLNTLMAPYGVQMTGLIGDWGVTTNIVSHPITQNVNSIYVDGVREISVTSPSMTLAWSNDLYAFLSAKVGGEVVVVSDSNVMDNYGLGIADNVQLMLNIFNWVGVKYEHDLAVTLDAPMFLNPGDSSLLNATVTNKGLNNESDVELFLLIDDAVVNFTMIPALLTGASYTINYLWTSTVEATYNVTAYAPPVPGENFTANNVKSVIVLVQVLPDILIVDDNDGGSWVQGTSLSKFESALMAASYDYLVWDQSSMGNPPLDYLINFPLVIWTCGDYWDWAVDPVDAVTLESYLTQGGNVLLEGEDIGYDHHADDFMVNVAHAVYQVDATGAPGLTVTDPTHPVTFGLPTSFTWFTNPPYDDGVSPTNGGEEVIQYTGTTWTAVTVFEGTSSGSVVYYAFPLYCLDGYRGETLAINSVRWLLGVPPPGEHDVAIISVTTSATEVYEGQMVNITVVAKNEGNVTETFDVNTYYNVSLIGTQIVTNLTAGLNVTLTFSWDTTGVKPSIISYTIKAVATPVPGETDTADNTYVDGGLKVKMVGDINGDGVVNIQDVVIAALAFGTQPGNPNWNPLADLNKDGKVNIVDLVIIAINFGKTIMN